MFQKRFYQNRSYYTDCFTVLDAYFEGNAIKFS